MSPHPTHDTARPAAASTRQVNNAETSARPLFGEELEGAFSPNLMRDQFDHLFRQFGR